MLFCTSLRNFIQIGPPAAKKMTSHRFSRWRISAILDFMGPIMGFFKSPCTTSYRSSIETIALNCLVFEKIALFCILATDRQTNRQTDEQMVSTDALSRYRCREWRLNNYTGCKPSPWRRQIILPILIDQTATRSGELACFLTHNVVFCYFYNSVDWISRKLFSFKIMRKFHVSRRHICRHEMYRTWTSWRIY